MATVLLIDGFSEDAVFINGKTPADICKIYLPYLTGLLRYNGIETNVIVQNGIEWGYKISGKTDRNLIYMPIISIADNASSDISFIYTDSTDPDSTAFRVASNIRRNCEALNPEKIIFINPLSEKDNFKRYSPIIVDNIRVPLDEKGFMAEHDKIFLRAEITAKSICEHYLSAFKKP